MVTYNLLAWVSGKKSIAKVCNQRRRWAMAKTKKKLRLFEYLEDRTLLSVSGIPDWISAGPAPELNGQTSGLTAQRNPVSGAINAIAAAPGDAQTIYVASVNGGIWVTHNALAPLDPFGANPTWKPLTDRFSSLSFGDIAFDPIDTANHTLWAGFGSTSSGASDGGPLLGLLKTTDDGASWTQLATNSLQGETVEKVLPTTQIDPLTNQQVILVATRSGLWRSVDAGSSFNRLIAVSGVESGSATDLIVNPGNANQFFDILLPCF